MMFARLAALGAIGYAAYKYFGKTPEPVKVAPGGSTRGSPDYAGPAGGPISGNASVVHPGDNPVD
jgi:hypothetical protein